VGGGALGIFGLYLDERADEGKHFLLVFFGELAEEEQGGLEVVVAGGLGGQEAGAAKDLFGWKFQGPGDGAAEPDTRSAISIQNI